MSGKPTIRSNVSGHDDTRRALDIVKQYLSAVVVSTDDISTPPSDAELDVAFGTPGDVGEGFVGVVNDGGAGTNVYIVFSDGSYWWHAAMTKAV